MCRVEHHFLAGALARLPAQPWIWLSPDAGWWPDPVPAGRGVRLSRQGPGYVGDVHCDVPLPLASESVNAIVLQHLPLASSTALLAECERVLMPGGRLWVTTLNPCSPYRLRWQRQRPAAALPLRWRTALVRSGLHCGDARYLGSLWGTDGRSRGLGLLRASCVLEAEKRVGAMVGPIPAPVRWRAPVAT